jgi:hypothetical protein
VFLPISSPVCTLALRRINMWFKRTCFQLHIRWFFPLPQGVSLRNSVTKVFCHTKQNSDSVCCKHKWFETAWKQDHGCEVPALLLSWPLYCNSLVWTLINTWKEKVQWLSTWPVTAQNDTNNKSMKVTPEIHFKVKVLVFIKHSYWPIGANNWIWYELIWVIGHIYSCRVLHVMEQNSWLYHGMEPSI